MTQTKIWTSESDHCSSMSTSLKFEIHTCGLLLINLKILIIMYCCAIQLNTSRNLYACEYQFAFHILFWDTNILLGDQTFRPNRSDVSKILPTLQLSSSVYPKRKSSLLLLKSSHWPKSEIFRPQQDEFNF
jgi:hypothetical protein